MAPQVLHPEFLNRTHPDESVNSEVPRTRDQLDQIVSVPFRPSNAVPGHTPKMLPTEKFASTIDDPSSGSKATAYLSPPSET